MILVLIVAFMLGAFGLQVMALWQNRVIDKILYISFAMLLFTAASILARFI